jgi:hypothetical protein
MRQLAFVVSIGAVVGFIAVSCGSDVDTNGAGTGGIGGAGGNGGGTTATDTSSSTGVMGCSDQQFPNKCEEACCKVQVTCGLTGACALAFAQIGIACGDPEAECVGEVILEPTTECADLPALATGTAPIELQNALLACLNDDPCLQCGIAACAEEAFACQDVMECTDFIGCVTDNSCTTQTCIDTCATDNSSTATTDLVTCIASNCPNECYQGGGGSGGSGGGGGAGGSGGN